MPENEKLSKIQINPPSMPEDQTKMPSPPTNSGHLNPQLTQEEQTSIREEQSGPERFGLERVGLRELAPELAQLLADIPQGIALGDLMAFPRSTPWNK